MVVVLNGLGCEVEFSYNGVNVGIKFEVLYENNQYVLVLYGKANASLACNIYGTFAFY